MVKILEHTVTLPAPAEKLFDMYMDPEIHAAIIGGPVTISSRAGSEFRAFGDMVLGKTLSVVPKRIIVQLWRGKDWKPEDRDSILILSFLPEKDAGKIELIHVNVPEREFDDTSSGWQKYYWKPWREYLEKEMKRAA